MTSEYTSSVDRRKYANAERVAAAIELDLGDSQVRQTIPHVFAMLTNLQGNCASDARKRQREEIAQDPNRQHELVKLHSIVERSDFDALWSKICPEFEKQVENHLTDGDANLAISLKPRSTSDFDPENIAKQVPGIRASLQKMQSIQSVRDGTSRNPKQQSLLAEALRDPSLIQAIKEIPPVS